VAAQGRERGASRVWRRLEIRERGQVRRAAWMA
jgi:hypothetical protein